jgi:hypothetical protein
MTASFCTTLSGIILQYRGFNLDWDEPGLLFKSATTETLYEYKACLEANA